ncbi:MAG TPA: PEP-CTERM sorting domain-containing protein [Leptolyngbyaceae cyanobacterium M33_DOE_097]|uniref:PEP-CTERM sorting domain-containing protein n=1 Tax=Oscillatoriales cyanobacterium SpSt-418 TaxID=2282169 RepID=A0A7C3PIB3_9CYAN|nr:PEP-CTERM sorting domain-containing protein [Leptolyngbyaceae cyanobacterium M33_DOE_097]
MLLKSDHFKKIFLPAITLFVSLGSASFQPVEAAYFYLGSTDSNFSGYLAYESEKENFSLTAIGLESIRLDQLNQEVNGLQFLLEGAVSLPYGSVDPQPAILQLSLANDVRLDFVDGDLVSITGQSDNTFFSGSEGRPGSCCSTYSGNVFFMTKLNLLNAFMQGTTTYYEPPTFENSYTSSFSSEIYRATLFFETIEPIQPIPEPATLFGVGVAAALGVAGRRAQKR